MSTIVTLFCDGRGPLMLRFFSSYSRAELLEGIREALALAEGTPLRFRDGLGS